MKKNETKEERLRRFEKKYEKKVDKLIKINQNNSMQELWIELDKLKEKMKIEFDEIVKVYGE